VSFHAIKLLSERGKTMFNFLKGSNRLNQAEAYQMLKADASILVVDVRTPEEFREGKIAKSINVPLDQLETLILKKVPDKSKKLFVICYSGSRSAAAMRILKHLGYTDIHDIGGIASWSYGITR
jgi:rhodanese-related sulfurtransferase